MYFVFWFLKCGGGYKGRFGVREFFGGRHQGAIKALGNGRASRPAPKAQFCQPYLGRKGGNTQVLWHALERTVPVCCPSCGLEAADWPGHCISGEFVHLHAYVICLSEQWTIFLFRPTSDNAQIQYNVGACEARREAGRGHRL